MYRCIRIALRSLCAFAATLALAQTVTFTPDLLTNDSFLFNSVAAADFNNDGREDLITACGSGNGNGQFAVNLSTGDGVYAPQVCYSLPAGQPYSIAVGDVNSDGNLDLIVANGTNTFYEYLNNGKGSFHLQASFQTTAPIYSIVAADANHDGTIDLGKAALWAILPPGWLLRIQQAVTLADSQPEPDFAIVRGNPRSYLVRHPGPTARVRPGVVNGFAQEVDIVAGCQRRRTRGRRIVGVRARFTGERRRGLG